LTMGRPQGSIAVRVGLWVLADGVLLFLGMDYTVKKEKDVQKMEMEKSHSGIVRGEGREAASKSTWMTRICKREKRRLQKRNKQKQKRAHHLRAVVCPG